jgi:hypothetical protein
LIAVIPPGLAFAQNSDTSRTLVAHRMASAPVIDGRLDDSVWSTIPVRRDFTRFAPREGGVPLFRNETWIGFDNRALYIAVRAHDPQPDSIIRRLARRDTFESAGDLILIFLDPWLDRRSGYQFALSAGGVKFDALLFDDGGSDASWDGVWDGNVSVDSAGWIAEFAIPFQELRFVRREELTFGIFVGRWVGRTGERSSIPQYRRSIAGLSSQMGTVMGIRTGASGRTELRPYMRAGSRGVLEESSGWRRQTTPGAGGDFKWLPLPSLSIDGTVNPDFGQVEADPAVLNLTGTEIFQSEKRPFFLEGAGLLSVPLSQDGSSLLFYSRRIGRAPTLSLFAADAPSQETTILGAARVTGRLTPTLSVAALSAFTQRESHENGAVVEPSASYSAARLQQDYRRGRSGVGAMITRVQRRLDDMTADYLPATASVAFLSTHHQTTDGDYQVSGWAARSQLDGHANAITATQQSLVHAWQRPDDGVAFDSLLTSMAGSAVNASIAKVGGGVTRFLANYRRIDPGFDVNDMGFLNVSGVQRLSASLGLRNGSAGRALGIAWRTAEISLGFSGDWATHGERLPYGRTVSLTGSLLSPGLATIAGSLSTQLGGGFCTVSCTRGGPALVDPPRTTAIVDVTSDPRRSLSGHVNLEYDVDDGGRSHGYGGTADVTWRMRSNLDVTVIGYAFNSDYDWFHYPRQRTGDSTAHAVASLWLPVRSITMRTNATLTTNVTLQWYGQAYVSRGSYADVRTISNPRAREWDDRFTPLTSSVGPAGIDYRQFRSNLVFRWEHSPGAALFVVWSQNRDLSGTTAGSPGLWPGSDYRGLFATRPDNVIVVKMSFRLTS